ncbi:MAG: AAA family ATPase, partial [Desulfomonilaceae bacterium]
MPKVLIAGRGGSGKSTIVALLAQAFAMNHRVLVVDADESNLSLGAMLGLKDPAATIMDFLGGKQDVRETLQATMGGRVGGERLFTGPLSVEHLPEKYVTSRTNMA